MIFSLQFSFIFLQTDKESRVHEGKACSVARSSGPVQSDGASCTLAPSSGRPCSRCCCRSGLRPIPAVSVAQCGQRARQVFSSNELCSDARNFPQIYPKCPKTQTPSDQLECGVQPFSEDALLHTQVSVA